MVQTADKRKQNFSFPPEMLDEIVRERDRRNALPRDARGGRRYTVTDLLLEAWTIARDELRSMPVPDPHSGICPDVLDVYGIARRVADEPLEYGK